jgi:photosystem II stability/assembly factor-like uncharacterized protein
MAPMPSDTPVNPPDAPLMPRHDLQTKFVDRSHGWITGYTEWGNGTIDAIATTSDGGITWRALPVPALDLNFGVERFYLGDHNRIRLLFTDAKTGWMYQKWLFQTHDSGQTWRQEHPRGTIVQMGKALDGTFWALEQVARRWTLWRVTGDSYSKWIKLGYQFPFAFNGVHLAVIDDQQAWMTYWVNFQGGDPNAGSHLYVTRDGGKNWVNVIPPIPCDTLPLVISPVDVQELWMGCGFGAGAGSRISAAFESSDGGVSWYQRRSDTLGYFSWLTALSKSFVYMTYVRASSVTITYDGGETWNDALMDCEFYDPKAFFIDESYGWAACDSSINRTTDGGRSWECINLPGNAVCQPKISYPTDTPSP